MDEIGGQELTQDVIQSADALGRIAQDESAFRLLVESIGHRITRYSAISGSFRCSIDAISCAIGYVLKNACSFVSSCAVYLPWNHRI
jgi:hypothetical protein